MQTKDALYAAVGAPVAVAKTLNARFESLRSEFETRSEELSQAAQKRLEEWAAEGRQVVTKVSDGKVVDELTAKVDFDQAREQVTKLRDQLEDMLATWRSSFRPVDETSSATERPAEKAESAETTPGPAAKTAAKPAAAKTSTKTSAKKPAAKKPAAKKSTGTKATASKATSQKNTGQAS